MIKPVLTFIPSIGKKGFGHGHRKVNSAKNGFGRGQNHCNVYGTSIEKSPSKVKQS
jgi:hypothetical protein